MTSAPKVGLIMIADPRLGNLLDGNPIITQPRQLLLEAGLEVVGGERVFTCEDEARPEAIRLRNEGCEGLVLNAVWFLRSNAIAGAAQAAGLPVLLWAIPDEDGATAVGYGVSHGALDEMGIQHEAVYGPWEEKKAHVLAWARAAAAKARLMGSRYGQIGGRCLEMMAADVDNNQVKRIFGIDYDHMEQWDLIHRAQAVPDEEALPYVEQWKKEFKAIQVTDEILLRSAKVYIAGKAVMKERRWDAFGIKCQSEFIDNYLAPCLPIGLWNDEGIVVACECDQNAAITMMAIHALSQAPVMFSDLSHIYFDTGIVRLLNCGVAAPFFAGGRGNVALTPCPEAQATLDEKTGKHLCKGGACTHFVATPGRGTVARFGRIRGEYVLHVTGCEIVEFPHDKTIMMGIGGVWPFAYLKPDESLGDFTQKIRAHHMCLAKGDWERELRALARLWNVRTL